MVGGLWIAFLRRGWGGGGGRGGGTPISECRQQGVQLFSLHATVYESGWGAKQGSGPSMEARPISDIRHRAARQVSGTPGRGMREWVFADRQLHALGECLPWHFSVLNQGEKLGRCLWSEGERKGEKRKGRGAERRGGKRGKEERGGERPSPRWENK